MKKKIKLQLENMEEMTLSQIASRASNKQDLESRCALPAVKSGAALNSCAVLCENRPIDEEKQPIVDKEAIRMKRDIQINRDKILLDVGGHKFATSLQTLTSLPDNYFESMFSGRFEVAPSADGTYFIDRDGTHFNLVLNFL